MRAKFFELLGDALRGRLPGNGAQAAMVPFDRAESLAPVPGFRAAAVLIALYEEDGQLRFPLIERTAGGHHSGQIALPGGSLEQGETAIEAAVREAREEIGLDCSIVEPIGSLTPFSVTVSRFNVTPVVARVDGAVDLCPSPAEVAAWFPVSLAELLSESSRGTATVRSRGRDREVPCFRLCGRIVWGATAIALAEFAAAVESAL